MRCLADAAALPVLRVAAGAAVVEVTGWQRFCRALPLFVALSAVTGVWVAGAVWSFEEQTAFAANRGFALPWLLPLTVDGLAVAMATVAFAAALDGRAAVSARLGTALAVAASATSNSAWAWTRSDGDPGTVALAAGVPVAANLAFEVLLSELRRQVHRRRGMPAPVAVPWPRLVRVALAPIGTAREWRRAVLALTSPAGYAPGGEALPVTGRAAEPAAAQAVPARELLVASRPALPASPDEPVYRKDVDEPAAADPTEAADSTEAADVADLLLVGRAVADELARTGQPLNRRNLLAGIRARGRSCSSERASALLRALRAA